VLENFVIQYELYTGKLVPYLHMYYKVLLTVAVELLHGSTVSL